MQNEQSSELINKEKQKYSLVLNIRSTQPPGILTLKQLLAETQRDSVVIQNTQMTSRVVGLLGGLIPVLVIF